jgi:hypothetical protein
MVDLTSVLEKLDGAVRGGEPLQLTPFETAVLHEFLSDIMRFERQLLGFDDLLLLPQ